MSPSPWDCLEKIPGLSALPAVWQDLTAQHFFAFKALCLEQTHHFATSFPCPRNCGCTHAIIPRHDRTGAVAVCRCEPTICPDIILTNDEAMPLRVNRPKLART